MMKRLIGVIFGGALLLWGATVINGDRSILGSWDASGATSTKPVKSGTVAAIPATCAVGQMYFATDGVAGRKVYECTATNTWTPVAYAQGTAAPGTCTVGQVFFDTDATAGQNWFGCTATNTWTAQGAASSGVTGYPITLFSQTGNINCNVSHFFGISSAISGTGESDGFKVKVPKAGTIRTAIFDLYQSGSPNTPTASGTAAIVVGSTGSSSTTNLSTSLTWPATFGSLHEVYTGLSIAVSQGDFVGGKLTTSACTSGSYTHYPRLTLYVD